MSDSHSTPTRFCPKCQCETERHPNGRCKPCKRAYLYQWRKENPEKVKAQKSNWYANHKQEITERHKSRLAQPEIAAKKRAINAAWKAANPEKKRRYDHTRRARKSGTAGALSKGIVTFLLMAQRNLCVCCRKPLGADYQLDHIVPLALGGTNTDDNVQLLRAKCNSQKHAKHPVDFMQSRGFLL